MESASRVRPWERAGVDCCVPDGLPIAQALARTTHLGIGAHADDLEIFAISAILECFEHPERWFTGVTLSDGAGSARGALGAISDAELVARRRQEQREAARLGRYSAQLQFGYPSAQLKDRDARERAIDELVQVLRATQPEIVLTHNLCDRHDTHVATTLCVLRACQRLSASERPQQLLGCEVWRDLDWLVDAQRVALLADQQEPLQRALLEVFESQLGGGKRYDLATLGRRRAHATYSASHVSDAHEGLVFAMDLSELLHGGDERQLVERAISAFREDVFSRLSRLGS